MLRKLALLGVPFLLMPAALALPAVVAHADDPAYLPLPLVLLLPLTSSTSAPSSATIAANTTATVQVAAPGQTAPAAVTATADGGNATVTAVLLGDGSVDISLTGAKPGTSAQICLNGVCVSVSVDGNGDAGYTFNP